MTPRIPLLPRRPPLHRWKPRPCHVLPPSSRVPPTASLLPRRRPAAAWLLKPKSPPALPLLLPPSAPPQGSPPGGVGIHQRRRASFPSLPPPSPVLTPPQPDKPFSRLAATSCVCLPPRLGPRHHRLPNAAPLDARARHYPPSVPRATVHAMCAKRGRETEWKMGICERGGREYI